MPPRFPHGLVRPPSKMDKSEMAVFALLGASVSVGLYRLGSDVWGWSGGGREGGGGGGGGGEGANNEEKETEEMSDNDIRERALDAIGKCDVHLKNFGKCAQDSGLLVLFQCKDLNAKIRDCMSEQHNNASRRDTQG